MSDPAPDYPEVHEELRALVVAVLVGLGVDHNVAQAAGHKVVERARKPEFWGGRKLYFPSGKAAETERMRREILARWNGRNTRELCGEFGISETWLQELHKQARSSHTPPLF